MAPEGRPRDLPQHGRGQEQRPQLPDGQEAEVEAEPRREEDRDTAHRVRDLEDAQGPRDGTGQERPQELHEQDRDPVQERVLDLLQEHEVVGEDVFPLAAQERVDAGAHGDEAEPQVRSQVPLVAEELQVVEAAGDEQDGKDERGQLAGQLVAGELVDGAQPIAAFDGRGHARAGHVGLPRAQREHEAPAFLDGGGGHEVEAVAVVVDASLRRQAAHAAQAVAAREHLVGAVHLADDEAQAQAGPLLRRGSEAVGADLDGQAVPRERLAGARVAAPAQRHAGARPGGVVVVVLRPSEVVAGPLAPIHREGDGPVERSDGDVGVPHAVGLGQRGRRPGCEEGGERGPDERRPSQDDPRPARGRAPAAPEASFPGSGVRTAAPPGGCPGRPGCRGRRRRGSAVRDPA